MEKYTIFNQIINTFKNISVSDNEEKNIIVTKKNIHIEPKIFYDKISDKLKIEIKIGNDTLYKVKSLPKFYDRFINRENYKYGSKLEFVHIKENFEDESQKILEYILKYAEITKYANEASNGYEYYTNRLGEDAILISNTGIDELFSVLENKIIEMETEGNSEFIEFINKEPDIKFYIKKKNENEYVLSCNYYEYKIFEGKEYNYLLLKDKLYKCSKKYSNTIISLMSTFKKNFVKNIKIPKDKLSSFFANVEPYIKKNLIIDETNKEEIISHRPAKLQAKMFLDYNENNYLIADIKFIYNDIEINPLDLSENKKIPRNEVEENKLLNMLINTGFMLDQENSLLVLVDDEKIYEFLSSEMDNYIKKFEVLVTEKFKEKQIKKFEKVSIGIKIENNLLDIDLSKFNISDYEIQKIMERYKLKKKYYRLKDGSFINLEENKNIEFIENMTKDIDISYSKIKGGKLELPVYRSFYLEKILDKNGLKSTKNETYNEFIDNFNKKYVPENENLPKNLKASLREYQQIGYNWLRVLDKYGLGGILADDMGLGKTVQLLAIICSYVENNKKSKPSLVVCPSSLTLNWQNEIEKFTSNVTSLVIHGSSEERQEQIKNIKKYNVVITSYELLKRDLEEYKKYNYEFKYIIADEAQYIKNNNTRNAKAIKEMKAETRYALTGTPIENSLSELWSIFDFIMPGYLFSYKKFKELYETQIVKEEDSYTTEKLKKLISPFVLRRIKGEVLTELPDKTVSILNSQMSEEQREVYMSYLAQAKKNVQEEINENGIERSQIKILALLTRLRQICCHPSLFIENYKGESGKLNQCIEIVKDAVESGHKILLFSGYTSMLEIIEQELKKEKINYRKLTGQTNVNDRVDLVDEFNEDDEIKVFLISLKTGGTGLNLTGADMVIHYDPWWNLSAENQATDRSYRIGQKRNVQVYKLITKYSIEEKIYELQKRKEMLIDNMLSTNQTFINSLTKEEILKLFE